MKKIEAIIRPVKLEPVQSALEKIVQGITITEVRGHGKQRGVSETYRGATLEVNLLSKIKVEVVVPDNLADQVIEAICAAARTGQVGDGKIFVYPVEEVIRVRTGERGEKAV